MSASTKSLMKLKHGQKIKLRKKLAFRELETGTRSNLARSLGRPRGTQ